MSGRGEGGHGSRGGGGRQEKPTPKVVHGPRVPQRPPGGGPKLFCDLDGVLADFETAALSHFPKVNNLGEIRKKDLWARLAAIDKGGVNGFYNQLDWMAGGRDPWAAIQHLKPEILTGLPFGRWAAPQKRAWCRRMLGPDVIVHTCMAREKLQFCQPGDLLIDDNEKNCEEWVSAGGVVIQHNDVTSTLRALDEHRELLQRILEQSRVAHASSSSAQQRASAGAAVEEAIAEVKHAADDIHNRTSAAAAASPGAGMAEDDDDEPDRKIQKT